MLKIAKCPACGESAAAQADWPDDESVRCPHCQAEFLLSGASSEPLATLSRVSAEADESVEPSAEAPAASLSSDRPEITVVDEPPEGLPSTYAVASDFLTQQQKEQLAAAATVASRLRAGSKKKQSCLGEVVKVLFGGVVGLAVGYWLLNYVGGERFDWLSVYLPGCRHTRDHWPAEYFQSEPGEPPAPSPKPQTSPRPIKALPRTEPPMTSENVEPGEDAKSPAPEPPPEIPKLPGLDEASSSTDLQPPELSPEQPEEAPTSEEPTKEQKDDQ